ncbi:MAG: hypothetical protein ACLFRD_07150 [Nitriliruptoraceae bacterium]
MPARASLRDLLADLLGRTVTVRPGPDLELDPERPAYLSGFRFDDGAPAAVAVTDLDLSLGAAAAIGAMPPQETREQVEQVGRLEGDLVDFLHEVLNVSSRLLNSPTTPHVVLRELAVVPGEVAEDLAQLATSPSQRHDWTVAIDGYGDGLITLLS